MPNFSSDAGCSCPSGTRAGIGEYHTEGALGCIHGKEEYIGKPVESHAQIAFDRWKRTISLARPFRSNREEAEAFAAFKAGWKAAGGT